MRHAALLLAALLASLAVVVGAGPPAAPQPARVSSDANDWPMYNRDVIGTRHNPAEKALSRATVGKLTEKWRFPAAGSKEKVGVVHATAVVNGHVYFGTETHPAVYKLAPNGKLKWVYRNPDHEKGGLLKALTGTFGLPTKGFLNAPLVTADTVYIGDLGGVVYALNRANGKLRWKVDTRSKPFPGAHGSNCVFAAPIVAEGKIVVAGGGFEHIVAAGPGNKGCTGRGLVAAFEPGSGKVAWKYDVGPEPGKLDPPVTVQYGSVKRVYHYGPSTSSVWCTPSYDAESRTIFFGTDCHNSPRQPTKDDPRLSTKHSCAVIAVDARTGKERWVTQITENDVWNYALPAHDPKTGYKDQAIGDTPKVYTITYGGKPRKVVGCGSKNGGFYVLDAKTGKVLHNTPIYTGPPAAPKKVDARTLALPSAMGGLQTGCATDGKAIYTNGTDFLGLGMKGGAVPTGGRVVSLRLDTRKENWRHERPKVKAVGGTKEKPAFTDVGDPVASGIAVANGVAYFTTATSNKLVAIDTSNGKTLREIGLGPVWCGPVVSRGRVYVGTGNLLFSPGNPREAYFPKSSTGAVISFGLPGKDEVDRLGDGDE
jgi:polyvinyl alcohol dehydrogenase (cytochrome)